MEWDSGAGHAVLKYAGGFATDTTTNEELVYNKNLLNPDFICYGSAIKKYEVYSVIVFIGVVFCRSGYDIAKSMSNRKSPQDIKSVLVMILKDKRGNSLESQLILYRSK